MRGKGAVFIGLMMLAIPAFAQEPSPEEQSDRPIRRSPYSYYGPYYVLDQDGEPTGEVREGGGRSYDADAYGYSDGWGGWDRGWAYGYNGRSLRSRWVWSAAEGRWVRSAQRRADGRAPRPAPSRR